jgi:hypothetical protein
MYEQKEKIPQKNIKKKKKNVWQRGFLLHRGLDTGDRNKWVGVWGERGGGSICIKVQRFTNLVIQTEHAKKDTDNLLEKHFQIQLKFGKANFVSPVSAF